MRRDDTPLSCTDSAALRWPRATDQAKYNMSLCAMGMSAEYSGIGFNCLWPRTGIHTAAIEMLAGDAGVNASRSVDIMSDAAHWILTQDNAQVSG